MITETNHDGHQTHTTTAMNQNHGSVDAPRQKTVTPSVSRLKFLIRRLPPGLTQEEFMSTLGPEWKVGQGRVDWALFKPGKISRDPSKPSRPSRAYIHLTDESYLSQLYEIVRRSVFEDALNTFRNQCLIGPPTIEYALFGYIPSNKTRVDARAGTIDQDIEFMNFLEGLANPTKDQNPETSIEVYPKQEKITTTPLVQFLIEKKATKNKEAAAKAVRKQEIQTSKSRNSKDSILNPDDTKKVRDGRSDRSAGKAAKESVKILNREAQSSTSSKPITPNSVKASPTNEKSRLQPTRQRGVAIATHIRMLQRDLGINPGQASRKIKRETADALKAEKTEAADEITSIAKETDSQPTQAVVIPTAPRGKLNNQNNRRGRSKGHLLGLDSNSSTPTVPNSQTPVVLLKKPESLRKNKTSNSADLVAPPIKVKTAGPLRKTMPATTSTENIVQAFVKHANLSQGITEPLLEEAMKSFGDVSKVEIDKRKGFAYVSFADMDGLKKAMDASPIPIAQGAVQVMPRKVSVLPSEKKITQQTPHTPPRSGRGGRGGNNGRRTSKPASKGFVTNNSTNVSLENAKNTKSQPNEERK
ncbi:putative nonsense-mediated mrna decay protein [Golovinomyces cichoracearum]|uniref:Putative nonsense-mediated mrna decay protein n=1 Tax=Golovinomyces cichoracearum TaxID=62708 RepID=A0A420H7Q5_9PEZI|nr:putative nonsense-mediated mrna decay protein [Golovinomyces cichoracearum]